MYPDGQQYHCCYCWLFLILLLHWWMSAGDGSSAGVRVWVCASSEAHRVSHIPRWAAVPLFLLAILGERRPVMGSLLE